MPNSPKITKIINVAVPLPLRQSYDFLLPDYLNVTDGCRVLVPFARRQLIGIVLEQKTTSELPLEQLKPIINVLDQVAIFSPPLIKLLHWLADYYLAPIGDVFDAALPAALRKGGEVQPASELAWRLSDYGQQANINELNKAPLQRAIVKRLIQHPTLSATDFKQQSSGWRQAVNSLEAKKWLEQLKIPPSLPKPQAANPKQITFNQEQQHTAEQLKQLVSEQRFQCALLHGVTGSGKTEVYFQAIQATLYLGKQVLLLVPEIGLTPQLLSRVQSQFSCPVACLHSSMTDTQRHLSWWHARQNNAQIIIGTRSAIFTDFADLGLIVIDEEHDLSYKQQEGIRYHARDVAVYRAKLNNIPIILASATPSLESYNNAKTKRYLYLRLQQRASQVALPNITLFDLNTAPSCDGLSPMMIENIKATLNANKQTMLFLNRRGFAPVLYCCDCKWTAKCHRCDSHLTVHQQHNRLRCHHCGYQGSLLTQCGACGSESLAEVGEGTQRTEQALKQLFPEANIVRIDRDSTSKKGQMQALLEQIHSHQADIILGTQLLTKGHDFEHLAMVGIINADQGLLSTDFRAQEYLFQQILQVAGRAGRRQQQGRVFIQTSFAEHPFFDWVKQHNYLGFAEQSLQQRQRANFPPFHYFALLRAESPHQNKALQFLRQAKAQLTKAQQVLVMDAIPAPMAKRAGKYRAQLLIQSPSRASLNRALSNWLASEPKPIARWNLDIDPVDLY